MKNDFLHTINESIDQQWDVMKGGSFFQYIRKNKVDLLFYQDLMVQIYHYTKHNSINQAAACVNIPSHVNANAVLKYIYRHSIEELEHEQMILRDLESINILDRTKLKQSPQPATEALIGYLYSVSSRYGAIARFGYSQWAENAYGHIREVTNKIRQDLSLKDRNMTFFIAHERIDKRHSAQVAEAIQNFCITSKDKNLVKTVARTTLYLTGRMLDGVAENYLLNCAKSANN